MRLISLMLVLGVQFLVAGTASATPQDRNVTLSISRSWAPYLLIDKDTGKRSGLVFDTLDEIAQRTGYQIGVELLPSKRSALYLEQGKIDAKLKAREWVDDADSYYWTSPMFDMKDVLVHRKDAPLAYQRSEDLRGKTIGARSGWGYPALESLFESGGAVREDAASDEAMLRMLLLGRVDTATMNVHVLKWMQTSNRRYRDELTFAERPMGVVGLRVFLSKRHDWRPFVEAFDQELEKMRTDGRLQAIVDRYLSR